MRKNQIPFREHHARREDGGARGQSFQEPLDSRFRARELETASTLDLAVGWQRNMSPEKRWRDQH
jgi:hypothetical protein